RRRELWVRGGGSPRRARREDLPDDGDRGARHRRGARRPGPHRESRHRRLRNLDRFGRDRAERCARRGHACRRRHPAAGLVAALRNFSADRSLLALEVVEYNPDLDRGRKTAVIVEEILAAVIGAPAASARSPEELERSFGARNYDSLPVVLVRGRGAHLWYDHGRRYLDLMSAYSAVSHGHCHPRLVAALSRQAQTLAVTSRAYYNTRLPLFLERLCRLTGQDQALPTNTGLEAVETALKAARKWAYKVKGGPEDSAEIIACRGK